MGPESIIITKGTTDGFQAQAFSDVQKQTSKTLVMLKSGLVVQQARYKGSKNEVAATGTPQQGKGLPKGTARLDKLINSDKTHTITEASRNGTFPNNGDAATGSLPDKAAVGTGSTIQYNPYNEASDEKSGILNVDGTRGRPAYIGLGHELIHAEDVNNGTLNIRAAPSKMIDPDNGESNADVMRKFNDPRLLLRVNEVKARAEDSAIRREQGVIERAQPCVE